MNRFKLFKILLFSFVLISFQAYPGEPQKLNAEQQQKKVNFLQHLINVIEWPKNSEKENNFYLCILGEPNDSDDTQFINQLKLKDKKAESLEIQNLSDIDNRCHLVYVTNINQNGLSNLLAQFKGKPVLLVSDIENFSKLGGHINFVTINQQFGAVVNTMTLSDAGLGLDLSQFNRIIVQPEDEDLSNPLQNPDHHDKKSK